MSRKTPRSHHLDYSIRDLLGVDENDVICEAFSLVRNRSNGKWHIRSFATGKVLCPDAAFFYDTQLFRTNICKKCAQALIHLSTDAS